MRYLARTLVSSAGMSSCRGRRGRSEATGWASSSASRSAFDAIDESFTVGTWAMSSSKLWMLPVVRAAGPCAGRLASQSRACPS